MSAVAFSPDGALLAGGDAIRDVRLYSTADGSCLNSGKWQSHTTRITGIAWSPSGEVRARHDRGRCSRRAEVFVLRLRCVCRSVVVSYIFVIILVRCVVLVFMWLWISVCGLRLCGISVTCCGLPLGTAPGDGCHRPPCVPLVAQV